MSDELRDTGYRRRMAASEAAVADAVADAVEALPADATAQQIAAATWRALATARGAVAAAIYRAELELLARE